MSGNAQAPDATVEHQKRVRQRRNDLCKCGSQRKFKRCCLAEFERQQRIECSIQLLRNMQCVLADAKNALLGSEKRGAE